MKQVTGKIKRAETQNQVSIQLKLGGHSFSLTTLPQEIADGSHCAKFIVLTAKSLLIPREAFEESLAANYLRLAGMECSEVEIPVWSDLKTPVIALMAADKECVMGLRKKIGMPVFTSPLLPEQEYTTPTVCLQWIETLLYIKVYNPNLELAEVLTTETTEDLFFCIEQLNKLFPLQKFTAEIKGNCSRKTAKLLRHYFRKTICE